MPNPWDYEVPTVLYKYLPPERFNVLTDCRFRFSQRAIFDDKRELEPEVAAFGTEEEIRKFIERGPEADFPKFLKDVTVKSILSKPGEQKRLAEFAQKHMQSPNEFGVFCMSESGNTRRM